MMSSLEIKTEEKKSGVWRQRRNEVDHCNQPLVLACGQQMWATFSLQRTILT